MTAEQMQQAKKTTITAALLILAGALAGSASAQEVQGYYGGYQNGGSQGGNRGNGGNGNYGGGYGGNRDRDFGNREIIRNKRLDLTGEVRTDRTQYNYGRAVQVTMTLINDGNAKRRMAPGRNGEFTVTIRDGRSGRAVYTTGTGTANPYVLGSGESSGSRILWDQRDSAGNRVPAGTYRIDVAFPLMGTISTQVYLMEDSERPEPGNSGNPGNPGNPGPDRPRPYQQHQGRPGGAPGDLNPGVPGNTQGLSGSLSLAGRGVKRGEMASFNYSVINPSAQPRVVRFRNGQFFDIVVTSASDRKAVWRFSEGMQFAQAFSSTPIAGGESRSFNAIWRIPTSLPAGQYEAVAYMTTADGQVAPTRTRFNIE